MVEAVLEDWRTAPIEGKLQTTLGFLEKLTLNPEAVGPEDVQPMLDAGVSVEAIDDAIHISAFFNVVDRMADSLDFDIPSADHFANTGTYLLKNGYVR